MTTSLETRAPWRRSLASRTWIRRVVPALLVTAALVATLVFGSGLTRTYASNVFGSLRAPGM